MNVLIFESSLRLTSLDPTPSSFWVSTLSVGLSVRSYPGYQSGCLPACLFPTSVVTLYPCVCLDETPMKHIDESRKYVARGYPWVLSNLCRSYPCTPRGRPSRYPCLHSTESLLRSGSPPRLLDQLSPAVVHLSSICLDSVPTLVLSTRNSGGTEISPLKRVPT